MKVEQYYSKNQFHLYGEGKDILQSYNSKVVEVEDLGNGKQKITLGADWDFSTTTSKYVYKFLEEFTMINFNGIVDKRKFVNRLIKEDLINYNEDMK